jgi:hypothetical protein
MALPIWFLLGLAAVAATLAIALLGYAKSAKSRSTDDGSGMLRVTRVIALVYGAVMLMVTITGVASTLFDREVSVTVPTREFWPMLRPGTEIVDGPSAEIVAGGFTEATLTIADLGMDARLLLAGHGAILGLSHVLVAIVVALLCQRLLVGDPFRRVLSRSVAIVAAVIAAGGFVAQVLFGIGSSVASEQALRISGWSSTSTLPTDDTSPGLPEPTFALNIDFTPLLIGLALVAVASAFRYAERLQRDTEGLV